MTSLTTSFSYILLNDRGHVSQVDKIKIEQAKNKITGYLDQSKVKWEEIPAEKRGPNTDFMIKIGEKNATLVYHTQKHPGRIVFEQMVLLGEQHRQLTKDMPRPKFNKIALGIASNSLLYDVEYFFVMDKENQNQLNAVKFYKFDYSDEITINRFYQALIKLEKVQQLMFNQISIAMGLEAQMSI